MTPRAAAIYLRISDDREGKGLGVERQREDCEGLTLGRSWPVAGVYVDNDISAFSGKRRPDYERLLIDIRSGAVDAVVAWHVDRLFRRLSDLAEFVETCQQHGVIVATVKAGEFDLSTGSGRMMAVILGSVAKGESDRQGERIRRKALELAQAGKVAGGGTRPFGFEQDFRTLREAEADVIRELADRIDAGETIHGLVRDLISRGVTTTTGKRWTPNVLRRMLMSGRIAGWREHHGALVAEAEWPAIIAREQLDRLRALLSDPSRTTNGGVNARSYLLSGIARCARCGGRLIARPMGRPKGIAKEDESPRSVARRRSYVCVRPDPVPLTNPDGTRALNRVGRPAWCGNGNLRVQAEPLEELVTEAVMQRLDSPEHDAMLTAATGDDDEARQLQAALAADNARLTALGDEKDDGLIDDAEYRRRRGRLIERIEASEKSLARRQSDTALRSLPLGGSRAVRAAWEDWGLDKRRALLAAVIERVEVSPVAPGKQGSNRFDPGRVNVRWRV